MARTRTVETLAEAERELKPLLRDLFDRHPSLQAAYSRALFRHYLTFVGLMAPVGGLCAFLANGLSLRFRAFDLALVAAVSLGLAALLFRRHIRGEITVRFLESCRSRGYLDPETAARIRAIHRDLPARTLIPFGYQDVVGGPAADADEPGDNRKARDAGKGGAAP